MSSGITDPHHHLPMCMFYAPMRMHYYLRTFTPPLTHPSSLVTLEHQHMCNDWSYYSSYQKIIPPKPIWIANDCIIDAVGIGDIHIQTHQGGHTNSGLIKGVLHLPKLCMSLLSTTKLANAGVGTKSSPQHLDLIDIHTSRLMDHAHRVQNLYKLQVDIVCSNELHLTQTHPPARAPLALWHHRLSHTSEETILT